MSRVVDVARSRRRCCVRWIRRSRPSRHSRSLVVARRFVQCIHRAGIMRRSCANIECNLQPVRRVRQRTPERSFAFAHHNHPSSLGRPSRVPTRRVDVRRRGEVASVHARCVYRVRCVVGRGGRQERGRARGSFRSSSSSFGAKLQPRIRVHDSPLVIISSSLSLQTRASSTTACFFGAGLKTASCKHCDPSARPSTASPSQPLHASPVRATYGIAAGKHVALDPSTLR